MSNDNEDILKEEYLKAMRQLSTRYTQSLPPDKAAELREIDITPIKKRIDWVNSKRLRALGGSWVTYPAGADITANLTKDVEALLLALQVFCEKSVLLPSDLELIKSILKTRESDIE